MASWNIDLNNGVMQYPLEKTYYSFEHIIQSYSKNIIHCMILLNIYIYIHVYTIFLSKSIHNIPFKKCVAFLWESSLQDAQQSLWKSMAECGII
jgi:hypothetical protein